MDGDADASDETAVIYTSDMQYTYAEYLAFEEKSDIRHEYFEGRIRRIAESTPEHAALSATVLFVVHKNFPRTCRAFTCSLRVRIPATGLTTYPDGSFACGRTEHTPEDPDAITNPLILFEVTGDNTEEYDRGEKLRHYQMLPALEEILIVSHREARITVHRRSGQQWTVEAGVAGQSVRLESIGADIDVEEVDRD